MMVDDDYNCYNFPGFLKARAGNDSVRLDKYEEYITHFCNEKHGEANKKSKKTD